MSLLEVGRTSGVRARPGTPGAQPLYQGLLALRPARGDDIGALTELLRRSWLGTMAPHLPPEGRERFEASDPAAGYCQEFWFEFTVAELDGLPVGMCHVQGDLVASIHVDPARKRQGIGRQLMVWALREIGRSHGAARLEVLAFNDHALRFYEALGWREASRITGEEMGCPVELVELRFELGDSAESAIPPR